jgi:hypothetical protein
MEKEIKNLEFWEYPEYIMSLATIDKTITKQDEFYYLTHTSYKAGLNHDWNHFENEEYGQVLNNLEGKVDEAFFELLDICYQIGEFDSRMIVLPEI